MTTRKDFDFYQHVYDILRERYRSSFIPYHEVYSYLESSSGACNIGVPS